ncbi:MAG TPA: DUF2804 family protein [Thermotogota bacterium]|nr:DUF2804 family protein [Thermotogota bacterium]
MTASNEKIKQINNPPYISVLRNPIPPPERVVKDGRCIFGTFNGPLPNVNLLDCKNPCGNWMPDFMKTMRLKEWFAYLIDFSQGFILSAIYNTGLMMFNVISFFDKESRQIQTNMIFTPKKKNVMAHSLIDSQIFLDAGGFKQEISNHLQEGRCSIKATCPASKKHFFYHADVSLDSVSDPSVVVMPLGPNKPLYIHKELFQARGSITIGERIFHLDETATCVIDDHKGYYPYHMTYDWISGIRTNEAQTTAFNIVDNQVLSPDDYNENFIWINGQMHPLPPVKVDKQSKRLWLAHDKHGAVDIRFEIDNDFIKRINLPFFRANYRAPFGRISGTIVDCNENKHELSGTVGIGEDLDYRY